MFLILFTAVIEDHSNWRLGVGKGEVVYTWKLSSQKGEAVGRIKGLSAHDEDLAAQATIAHPTAPLKGHSADFASYASPGLSLAENI